MPDWLIVGSGPSRRFVPGFANVLCLNRNALAWPEPSFAAMGWYDVLPDLAPIAGRIRGLVLQACCYAPGEYSAVWEGRDFSDWLAPFLSRPIFYVPFETREPGAGAWFTPEGIPVVRGHASEIALHFLHVIGVRECAYTGIDGGGPGGAYDCAPPQFAALAAALRMEVSRA